MLDYPFSCVDIHIRILYPGRHIATIAIYLELSFICFFSISFWKFVNYMK